ncbi:hypothetical protein KW797_03505, partial [Candidatus Parcubacteria bacterium]|nr:hypothetical protein [Candidatus Parcubacteria bacterium]
MDNEVKKEELLAEAETAAVEKAPEALGEATAAAAPEAPKVVAPAAKPAERGSDRDRGGSRG